MIKLQKFVDGGIPAGCVYTIKKEDKFLFVSKKLLNPRNKSDGVVMIQLYEGETTFCRVECELNVVMTGKKFSYRGINPQWLKIKFCGYSIKNSLSLEKYTLAEGGDDFTTIANEEGGESSSITLKFDSMKIHYRNSFNTLGDEFYFFDYLELGDEKFMISEE